MKNIFTKLLYSFILLLIVFYIWRPSAVIFLVLFDGIWLLALIKYGRGCNQHFWNSMSVISVAGSLAFLCAKFSAGSTCRLMTLCEKILVIIACLEILISGIIILYQFVSSKRKQQDIANKPELMKARRYDLIRLKDYIRKHQIVGVNGVWGSGKSFLIQKLYEEEGVQGEFEVIPIDLLAVHLEEIEKILMRNMDDIMEKYGIFSGVSAKLQRLLGSYKFIDHVKSLFFQDTEIVSSAFQKYKKDVDKMPSGKKILIVFDDIDRIVDKEEIMKIFALSERFSSERIHILYQFGYEYLENRDFDRRELEKFIPYVVTLTDIPYSDMVGHLWKECHMKRTGLKQEEVRFLSTRTIYNYEVNRMLGKRDIQFSITMENLPIRGVKIFLRELETMISENPFYQEKENKNILMAVLFVKNFMYEHFEQMWMGKDIVDTLLFEVKDETGTAIEKKTMRELIYDVKTTEDKVAFERAIKANKPIYFILNLLNYDFFIEDEKGDREERANAEPETIKRRQNNERINHIVWNVIGNGFSEYSDAEQAVKMLCESVLTDDCSQWEEHWKDLGQKSYVLNLYKNNNGIFRFGLDSYLPFFQAMRVNFYVTEEQWRRWIKFYFWKVGKKGITIEMIECLNYCDFTKGTDLYLDTIRHFCGCTVIGNMNDKRCFLTFMHTFISPVSYWQYSNSHYFEEWRFKFKDWKEGTLALLKEQLEYGKEALEKEKKNNLVRKFVEEITMIQRFVQKCLDIMDAEKTVTANEFQVKVSEPRTVHKHQEELDRLEDMLEKLNPEDEKGREEFIFILGEKYWERKINPSEYHIICNSYKRKVEHHVRQTDQKGY